MGDAFHLRITGIPASSMAMDTKSMSPGTRCGIPPEKNAISRAERPANEAIIATATAPVSCTGWWIPACFSIICIVNQIEIFPSFFFLAQHQKMAAQRQYIAQAKGADQDGVYDRIVPEQAEKAGK